MGGIIHADGKLTVTSKEVEGLERAVVTLKSGNASTKIRVTVTDSENYEIVDLRIGDTKTYVDKTGNYADSSLEGLDKTIAEVVKPVPAFFRPRIQQDRGSIRAPA